MSDDNSIIFMAKPTKEVMRITYDRILIPEGVTVDEAAQGVISALEAYVKNLVHMAVAEEREECAKACDRAVGSASMYSCPDTANFAYGIVNNCQDLIRSRG